MMNLKETLEGALLGFTVLTVSTYFMRNQHGASFRVRSSQHLIDTNNHVGFFPRF
jgi:hypothetical protein